MLNLEGNSVTVNGITSLGRHGDHQILCIFIYQIWYVFNGDHRIYIYMYIYRSICTWMANAFPMTTDEHVKHRSFDQLHFAFGHAWDLPLRKRVKIHQAAYWDSGTVVMNTMLCQRLPWTPKHGINANICMIIVKWCCFSSGIDKCQANIRI